MSFYILFKMCHQGKLGCWLKLKHSTLENLEAITNQFIISNFHMRFIKKKLKNNQNQIIMDNPHISNRLYFFTCFTHALSFVSDFSSILFNGFHSLISYFSFSTWMICWLKLFRFIEGFLKLNIWMWINLKYFYSAANMKNFHILAIAQLKSCESARKLLFCRSP